MTDAATHDPVIATIHRLQLSLAAKCRQRIGVTHEDTAIAAVYAALDMATDYVGGDKATGLFWLRCALDLIEADQPVMVESIQ